MHNLDYMALILSETWNSIRNANYFFKALIKKRAAWKYFPHFYSIAGEKKVITHHSSGDIYG